MAPNTTQDEYSIDMGYPVLELALAIRVGNFSHGPVEHDEFRPWRLTVGYQALEEIFVVLVIKRSEYSDQGHRAY